MSYYNSPLAIAYTTHLLEVKRKPLEEVRAFMSQHPDFEHPVGIMDGRMLDYLHRRLKEVHEDEYHRVRHSRPIDLQRQIEQDWKQWKSDMRRARVDHIDEETMHSGMSGILGWDDGQSGGGSSRPARRSDRWHDGRSTSGGSSRSSRSIRTGPSSVASGSTRSSRSSRSSLWSSGSMSRHESGAPYSVWGL